MRGAELNAAILAAHAAGDRVALAALYAQAAGGAGEAERAFFLTQAYVFALECGDATAAALRAQLVALGRETA
ncbi:MAG: hypothetical protein ACU0DK_03435 [Pseudooceanicola sp.]